MTSVTERSLLSQPMTPVTGTVRAAGGVTGTGSTIVVEHTGDNLLAQFRFQFASVKMSAAEAEFEAGGRKFAPGAIIIPNANRAQLEPALRDLGLSGFAVASVPSVAQHDLDVPRIGYIHSWGNTQDEGWVRAALDHYKIPYTYFGENEVVKRDLRAQFDVILWPHGGGIGQDPPTGGTPVPFMKSPEFPALGYPDQTMDTRGGLGPTGLKKLYEFVRAGGTLITEGGTSSIFPTNYLTPGITVDQGQGLIAPGSVYRGIVSDRTSPSLQIRESPPVITRPTAAHCSVSVASPDRWRSAGLCRRAAAAAAITRTLSRWVSATPGAGIRWADWSPAL
jgi:hypothetical protein